MRQSPFLIAGFAFIVALMTGCGRKVTPPEQYRGDAAKWLTDRYAKSRISHWNLHVGTAGPECNILYIDVPLQADDITIESLQYGAGAYDIYPGGVNRFYRERTFQGVAYIDASQRVWTYGAVTWKTFAQMKPCN